MAREVYKDKQPGDTLGAAHINKLNRAARIVTSGHAGAYAYGNEYAGANPVPFLQRLVIITDDDIEVSDESDGEGNEKYAVYGCKPRYFDPTEADPDDRWKTYDDENEYDLDAGSVGATFANNDILIAYWEPQRGAYIPLTSPCPYYWEIYVENGSAPPSSGVARFNVEIDGTTEEVTLEYDFSATQLKDELMQEFPDLSETDITVTGGPLPVFPLYVEWAIAGIEWPPTAGTSTLNNSCQMKIRQINPRD